MQPSAHQLPASQPGEAQPAAYQVWPAEQLQAEAKQSRQSRYAECDYCLHEPCYGECCPECGLPVAVSLAPTSYVGAAERSLLSANRSVVAAGLGILAGAVYLAAMAPPVS